MVGTLGSQSAWLSGDGDNHEATLKTFVVAIMLGRIHRRRFMREISALYSAVRRLKTHPTH